MRAIAATYGIERGTVLALAAGADAICVGGGLADEDTVLRLRDALVGAVRDGELPEERLADAAARVRALGGWVRERAAGGVRRPGPTATADPARTSAWSPPAARCGSPAADRTRRRGARSYVAAFTPVANIAVGDETPWGVAAELARPAARHRDRDVPPDRRDGAWSARVGRKCARFGGGP